MPGAPYLLAGLMSIWSLIYTYELICDDVHCQKASTFSVEEEIVGLLQ